ncbi:MAG TPA: non-canonical purine NTP pyrophosphatase [Thermoanaerobaculia bacterium]|nr:non-canonical purine NTP pyrophosphatase [Thermoanaerobaculia bacterium]
MPPFVLVTGNPGKLEEARRITEINFEAAAVDLPEIQSLDYLEILRGKAAQAWELLHRPLVVEEAGLDLAALNGFPGSLVKWMLQAVGAEGISRTALAVGDTRAAARCFLIYKDGDREIVATGTTFGKVVFPARGDKGFGWDPIFQPDGEANTFAELSDPNKDRVSHRGKAWQELLNKLERMSKQERARKQGWL